MTNFEKMKYLHRNTMKKEAAGSVAEAPEKKDVKCPSGRKAAGKKETVPVPGAGDKKKGAGNEETDEDECEEDAGFNSGPCSGGGSGGGVREKEQQ